MCSSHLFLGLCSGFECAGRYGVCTSQTPEVKVVNPSVPEEQSGGINKLKDLGQGDNKDG